MRSEYSARGCTRTGREATSIGYIGVENVDATASRIEHLAESEVERPAHHVGLPV